MKRILKKRMWLAGASLLAILLGTAEASAVVFIGPQGAGAGYVVPLSGWYGLKVAGAQGGGPRDTGGFGAIVGGQLFLDAGDALGIVVGGGEVGVEDSTASGGGGGSFVFGAPGGLLFAAGGGGGAGFGGPRGGPGIASGGHRGGEGSYGGAGGDAPGVFFPGSDPDYPGLPAESGSFPFGGRGAQVCFAPGNCFTLAPDGGYGGGGGGGYNVGGGGGGAPGGGVGKGGYSYVTSTARNPFGITGGNGNAAYGSFHSAPGYVSIDFVAFTVPESSTWAMTLAGFAGLGLLARLRKRKPTRA